MIDSRLVMWIKANRLILSMLCFGIVSAIYYIVSLNPHLQVYDDILYRQNGNIWQSKLAPYNILFKQPMRPNDLLSCVSLVFLGMGIWLFPTHPY